jgi:hypothetical protein
LVLVFLPNGKIKTANDPPPSEDWDDSTNKPRLYYSLDGIFVMSYIPCVAWDIEYTDAFQNWWDGLTEAEQEDITSAVGVLEVAGPSLRRPKSGNIDTSRHANMKELIVQHAGRPYRVLYIFDPRRNGILLIGGDKTGNDRWYDEFVPVADKIYDEHLVQIKKEGLI